MNSDSSGSSSPRAITVEQTEQGSVLKTETNPFHGGKRTVLAALLANCTIAAIKAIAGILGGQSSLLAEAIHSFADGLNSCFLMVGLQKGSKQADKTHPFGYGLETTLWATVASLAMLILSAWSIWIGVNRIIEPQPFEGYWLSASTLVVSLLIEIAALKVACQAIFVDQGEPINIGRNPLSAYVLAAKMVSKTSSPTTRFVFWEDSLAFLGTLVAFIAITLSQFGTQLGILPHQYHHIPDAVGSIFIGLFLTILGVYLFINNSKSLTGMSASPEKEAKIRETVLGIHGVSKIHDLRTADYGLSGVVVTLRVEVSPEIQVKDVDDLTDHIKERLQTRMRSIKEVIIEVLADETDEVWSEQFYKLIGKGQKQEVLKESEARILQNIYDFTKAVASEVMIPRTAVETIHNEETLADLMQLFEDSGETRILVYGEDLDNILGVIYARDIFAKLKNTQDIKKSGFTDLIKPIQVYPETKPVSDLLEDFKRKKIQVAMVADEHGGFAGIVTLEDLLEEIVGDVWEEDEEEELILEQPEPNRAICSGRYPIDELNEALSLHIPDEEFNTIGGFVFGLIGEAPEVGREVQFEGVNFKVLVVDHLRIDKLEITSQDDFVPAEDPLDKAILEAELETAEIETPVEQPAVEKPEPINEPKVKAIAPETKEKQKELLNLTDKVSTSSTHFLM